MKLFFAKLKTFIEIVKLPSYEANALRDTEYDYEGWEAFEEFAEEYTE